MVRVCAHMRGGRAQERVAVGGGVCAPGTAPGPSPPPEAQLRPALAASLAPRCPPAKGQRSCPSARAGLRGRGDAARRVCLRRTRSADATGPPLEVHAGGRGLPTGHPAPPRALLPGAAASAGDGGAAVTAPAPPPPRSRAGLPYGGGSTRATPAPTCSTASSSSTACRARTGAFTPATWRAARPPGPSTPRCTSTVSGRAPRPPRGGWEVPQSQGGLFRPGPRTPRQEADRMCAL